MKRHWRIHTVLMAVSAILLLTTVGCESGGDDSGDESYCGNGYCESGESASNCPGDCGGGGGEVCGNDYCGSGENVSNCPEDCGDGLVCGDGSCDSGESASNCPEDCGPATWTDSSSGLMWQNWASTTAVGWTEAQQVCPNLEVGGYGDWRLPTIGELRSLIRGCPSTVTGGACGVADDCLHASCYSETDTDCNNGCSLGGGPADGCYWPEQMQGKCDPYWSSSLVADYSIELWLVGFGKGNIFPKKHDTFEYYVRCVR